MKIFNAIKMVLYWLIQWTWGFLQSAFGLVMLIKFRKCKREFYHGAVCVYHDQKFGGISLGMFIFVNGNRSEEWIKTCRVHEYGHTIQSLVLGVFYLAVIGAPSAKWCNDKKYIEKRKSEGVSYYDFYPEKYANRLGERVTGESAPSSESGIPREYFEARGESELAKNGRIENA